MPKSSAPPVLPEVKLHRVIRIARGNSAGVIVCAGMSLVLSVPAENWIFAAFAALALVCGAMEWHGQERLREGDRGGMEWLTGAQLCLYTVIIGYALWRWKHFVPATYWAEIPAPAQEQLLAQIREAKLDPETDRDLLLRTMNGLVCTVLVGVSTLYQVGLTLWYRAQSAAVATALENPSTRRVAGD